jgi:hypothetical protein
LSEGLGALQLKRPELDDNSHFASVICDRICRVAIVQGLPGAFNTLSVWIAGIPHARSEDAIQDLVAQ